MTLLLTLIRRILAALPIEAENGTKHWISSPRRRRLVSRTHTALGGTHFEEQIEQSLLQFLQPADGANGGRCIFMSALEFRAIT